MLRLCLALSLLITTPATAELALGAFKTIETRFGTIGVVWRPEGQEFVLWNGQTVEGLETAEITIAGGYATQNEPFDWVLFNTRHSGNMCPHGYVLAKVSAAGVQRTQTFGECLGKARDLRVTPGQIALDLGDSDIRYTHQTFTYTGDAFTQTAHAVPAASGVAGAGDQVTRWAGKSLYELLLDPTEVARFSSVMSPTMLEDLRMASSVANPSQLRGDWLIGSGCQPHACNAVAGLWAIRVSDGTPFGAFLYDTQPAAIQGEAALLNDPVLAQALNTLQAQMNR